MAIIRTANYSQYAIYDPPLIAVLDIQINFNDHNSQHLQRIKTKLMDVRIAMVTILEPYSVVPTPREGGTSTKCLSMTTLDLKLQRRDAQLL